VIARPLVAQRALDQDEVGRRAHRHDLAGRRHADEEPAPRSEELLGDKHGEGCANRAADDTELELCLAEAVELGVIAGPVRVAG